MRKRARPELRAFDEVWAPLSPAEQEEAERLLLRYLELVVIIADEAAARERAAGPLTPPGEDRTLALSGLRQTGAAITSKNAE